MRGRAPGRPAAQRVRSRFCVVTLAADTFAQQGQTSQTGAEKREGGRFGSCARTGVDGVEAGHQTVAVVDVSAPAVIPAEDGATGLRVEPYIAGGVTGSSRHNVQQEVGARARGVGERRGKGDRQRVGEGPGLSQAATDRKSTRLNSSHLGSSCAGFCLKKKR